MESVVAVSGGSWIPGREHWQMLMLMRGKGSGVDWRGG